MVKQIIIILLFLSLLNASDFENDCLSCHTNDFKFNMMMKRYTQKYSSEKRIKKAIFQYLKNPSKEKSILPFGYINRFGIKEKTNLKDKELKNMINVYYDRYNIKDKIY